MDNFYCKVLEKGKIPIRGTRLSAGFDIFNPSDILLEPYINTSIRTNLIFQPPEGYYIQIKNRSSIVNKENLWVYEGVIDNDFRGNMDIRITNYNNYPYLLVEGQRIAQIILIPYYTKDIIQVNELNEDTERGKGEYGSTGK